MQIWLPERFLKVSDAFMFSDTQMSWFENLLFKIIGQLNLPIDELQSFVGEQ